MQWISNTCSLGLCREGLDPSSIETAGSTVFVRDVVARPIRRLLFKWRLKDNLWTAVEPLVKQEDRKQHFKRFAS